MGGGDNEAAVVLRSGPLMAPVLSRVVGMLAARAECPIDRLDDALLLADAVAAGGAAVGVDGRLAVRVSTVNGALLLNVGPLREHGAEAIVAAADLPGVGNILDHVADDVIPEVCDGVEHLHIRLGFAA